MKKHVVTFVMLSCLAWTQVRANDPAENKLPSEMLVEMQADTIQPSGVFNVLTYDVKADFAIKNSGLKEAGLAAGQLVRASDEIRIFSSRSVMNAAPLARIWLARQAGEVAYWFQTGGNGSAEDYIIPKGAVVVVWTRASTSPVHWTNVFH